MPSPCWQGELACHITKSGKMIQFELFMWQICNCKTKVGN
jgi:hypothetical protein